ncbi:MAG: hypothetical protein KY451_03725 [Actinobacteria bacterium]|nr:hypothetical protein [Actinomycetota bacterium]
MGSVRQPLAEAFAECAGNWIAIDRATNEVVAAAPTPYALTADLRARQIKNVAVLRARDLAEPELVGLG